MTTKLRLLADMPHATRTKCLHGRVYEIGHYWDDEKAEPGISS